MEAKKDIEIEVSQLLFYFELRIMLRQDFILC